MKRFTLFWYQKIWLLDLKWLESQPLISTLAWIVNWRIYWLEDTVILWLTVPQVSEPRAIGIFAQNDVILSGDDSDGNGSNNDNGDTAGIEDSNIHGHAIDGSVDGDDGNSSVGYNGTIPTLLL